MTPFETPGLIEREPVAVFLAGLAGVVDAFLALAKVMHWVDLDPGQLASLTAFVAGVSTLVASTLRARVWSPASHATAVNLARTEPR